MSLTATIIGWKRRKQGKICPFSASRWERVQKQSVDERCGLERFDAKVLCLLEIQKFAVDTLCLALQWVAQAPLTIFLQSTWGMKNSVWRPFVHKCPPLFIGKYSFIQLNELEQCGVNKTCSRFNTAALDSNPGSISRGPDVLATAPLRYCRWIYAHLCRQRAFLTSRSFVFVISWRLSWHWCLHARNLRVISEFGVRSVIGTTCL